MDETTTKKSRTKPVLNSSMDNLMLSESEILAKPKVEKTGTTTRTKPTLNSSGCTECKQEVI